MYLSCYWFISLTFAFSIFSPTSQLFLISSLKFINGLSFPYALTSVPILAKNIFHIFCSCVVLLISLIGWLASYFLFPFLSMLPNTLSIHSNNFFAIVSYTSCICLLDTNLLLIISCREVPKLFLVDYF